MAQVASEDLESVASHGDALTTSNTSFDTVSSSLKGYGTAPLEGAFSGWVDNQSAIAVGRFNTSTLGAGRAITGIRGSFMLLDTPGASSYLINVWNAAGTATGQLGFTTANKIRLRNNNSQTGTPIDVSLNTKYYFRWLLNNTAGTSVLELYDETGSSIGTISGTHSVGTMDEVDIGNNASVSGGWDCLFDEIVVDNAVAPALPDLSTDVNSSDTGSGSSETNAIAVALTQTETGSGTESQSITVSFTQADTGAGTEAATLGLSAADTGSADESSALEAAISGSETGTGDETDDLTSTEAKAESDEGTGSDDWSLAVSLTVTDLATSVESDPGLDKALAESDSFSAYERHWILYKRHLTLLGAATGGSPKPSRRPYPFPS